MERKGSEMTRYRSSEHGSNTYPPFACDRVFRNHCIYMNIFHGLVLMLRYDMVAYVFVILMYNL